jgi:hypothetical protein
MTSMMNAGWRIEVFDGERLRVPDDYKSLPLKTKALCQWALDNGFQRMLKLDDDAFVYLKNFKIVYEDYAGMWIPKNDLGVPDRNILPLPPGTTKFDYASGGGYWLSERSMKIIVETQITDWAEDRWVGQALALAAIGFRSLPDYLIQGYPFYHSDHPALITQVKDMKALHAEHL